MMLSRIMESGGTLMSVNFTLPKSALGHLTCLRILLLHNNQMKRLEDCVAELRNLQHLHTVTLFLNRFSQKTGCRHYVVHNLPSVQLLDRRGMKQEERNSSLQLFSTEYHCVPQSLAFGRRAETPASRETGIYGEGRHLTHGAHSMRQQIRVCAGPCRDLSCSSPLWTGGPSPPPKEWSQPGANILTVMFR
ncbi:hypothetical protein J4Q44_G00018520 [Coregonus suidteri]|uniref:Uncharacterized protein n=1 Tax=Coregonus suidteri TaxID=861788 RepID=A0AAN8MIR5_9TELE